MLAVIKTGGKQYKVSPGQKIKIEKLDGAAGDSVIFDEILLTAEMRGTSPAQILSEQNLGGQAQKNAEVKIGQPFIKNAEVSAKILKQGRDEKVTILKYKSKKRHSVKRGHRQPYTLVEIQNF